MTSGESGDTPLAQAHAHPSTPNPIMTSRRHSQVIRFGPHCVYAPAVFAFVPTNEVKPLLEIYFFQSHF